MDTISYEQKNKGALYEHPCLLYEAKKRKGENRKLSTPLRALPSVAMGIATLRGHRMTSSHSSKDPLRPPVSGGQSKRKTDLRSLMSKGDCFSLMSVGELIKVKTEN